MEGNQDERVTEIIRQKASEFLERESNRNTLITVTNVRLENGGKQATIYFTVLPSDKEKGALDFVKRKRAEFRDYLKKETVDIKTDKEQGLWLVDMLGKLAITNLKTYTFLEIKQSFESANLGDFELFWDNKPINTLYKAGLLQL